MKKLLVLLLGLASLNVYANGCGGEYQPATGTCRIIDSSGRQILYNVGRPQSSNNGYSQNQPSVVNIDVPSKYGAWAVNIKQVFQAVQSRWIHLLLQKNKPSKLVNRVAVMHHV